MELILMLMKKMKVIRLWNIGQAHKNHTTVFESLLDKKCVPGLMTVGHKVMRNGANAKVDAKKLNQYCPFCLVWLIIVWDQPSRHLFIRGKIKLWNTTTANNNQMIETTYKSSVYLHTYASTYTIYGKCPKLSNMLFHAFFFCLKFVFTHLV